MARKRSVQELMGVRRFTKYGLFTDRGALIFYQVNPTNISVLSKANIETKITHLKMLLLLCRNTQVLRRYFRHKPSSLQESHIRWNR